MATAAKTAAVAEIRDAFRDSSAAVLTEYRGLTVAQLKELRRTLAGNATYAVVKNTLTKIAAADAGIAGFDSLLEGPSAIAFVSGDPVTVAKGIRDFARTNPLLVIKGGVLDGRPLSADEVRRLADLESREMLLARLAGAMQASLAGAVSLIAAPLSQAARVLAALQSAAEADPSILAGGAGTPAEPAVDAPATDSAATTDSPTAAEPATTADSSSAEDMTTDAPSGEDTTTDSPTAPEPATAPDAAVGDEPATSGDAADAAVAADAVARDEAPAVEIPADAAPELPATQALDEPPA